VDGSCAFCNKHHDSMPTDQFELCSRAHEFTELPKPGQIWFTGTGYNEGYVVIVQVDPHGNYRTGASVTERMIYSFSRTHSGFYDYSRVRPDWPCQGWRLVQDSDVDPWDVCDRDRIELLLEA